MKPTEIIDISLQIASALNAAHSAGIVHRDVKPENIILRRDGLVKVVDFGLAKLIERKTSIVGLIESVKNDETAQGIILGTVEYMLPEQARGERVDRRTDIFSLGVLIYEMISGVNPFSSSSVKETLKRLLDHEPQDLSEYRADIPDELRETVSKMLTKDKAERFQAIGETTTPFTALKKHYAVEFENEKSAAAKGADNVLNLEIPASSDETEGERPTVRFEAEMALFHPAAIEEKAAPDEPARQSTTGTLTNRPTDFRILPETARKASLSAESDDNKPVVPGGENALRPSRLRFAMIVLLSVFIGGYLVINSYYFPHFERLSFTAVL